VIRRTKQLEIAVAVFAAMVILMFSRPAVDLVRGLRVSSALGKLGPADAKQVPQIVARLEDSNALVREAAASALGRIGLTTKLVTRALLEHLRDPSAPVRSNAAWALGALGPIAEAIPALTQALDDDDQEVRRYAAFGLCCMAPLAGPAVPKLVERLDDPHMGYMAARALGAIGPSANGSIPRLLAALRRDHSLARGEYAAALGKFGTLSSEALPDLRTLANDPDPNINRAASAALARIQPELAVP
jgi:hypothetical protein